MRVGKAILVAVTLGLAGGALAQGAEGPVPERRIAVTENVDFYGGDLRSIFDTSYEACRAVCLAESTCKAFTYNTRSSACFPKTDVTERQPYDGAISAIVFETSPGVFAIAETRQAELNFLREGDFRGARDAAQQLSELHRVGDFPVEDYIRSATEARASGNLTRAIGLGGAAILLSDAPDLWRTYAEDLLTTRNTNIRNRLGRALSASINAYLRADNPALRASILLTMSRAFEENNRGRDMIPALRLASSLTRREDIDAALERAIERYGFRVVDTSVESDSLVPRICAQFNEPLAEAGVDYATFVQLDQQGLGVEAQGQSLCIEGVRHGERHQVTFREGLPAASGEVTQEDVTLTLYVRDRSPAVSFPGRAYVLPKAGEAAIPVTTVNATTLDLALFRISDRNFVRAVQNGYLSRQFTYWREEGSSDGMSEQVWRGTGAVENVLNQDVTTRLPMSDLIAGLEPGLYTLQARVSGEDQGDGSVAAQSFVVSDLGLATMGGIDGLHVFVRSLGSAEPRAGLKVTLLSGTNDILGTTQTDQDGYAVFSAGLTRGTGASAPDLVMVEDGTADIAFLSLKEPEFDLSDRGVEGREPAPAVDLFMTTDRGAYRAGETIHLTALSRDTTSEAIEGLPLTAILKRPDGVEYSRNLAAASEAGGYVFALPVGSTAPRGSWTIAVHVDVNAAPLATRTVLVEDFLPERIDFELSLPDGPIAPTDTPLIMVDARYLFGPPAADLPVEGTVRLRAVRELPDYPGYQFGRYDAPFSAATEVFGGVRTGADGQATVSISFPPVDLADRPLRADIVTTVQEGSGRPVERRIARLLTPASALIGIRPLFEDVAARGAPAEFQVIAVGTDGERTAMPIKWTLNKVDIRYQWYRTYGNWQWEPITTRRPVTSGEAELTADAPVTVATPVDWGYYELRVERADGTFAVSSVDFYAGWYAPADASQTPDTLDLSLDQPAYRPGDTATVTIVPRFAGKALVSVVSNRLIDMQAVDVAEGANTVTFPVTDDWGTGAYVTATVIRPMEVDAGRNPARALGLAHATIDPGERQLQTAFEVAAEVDPRGPLDVALKVDGVAEGETAWATIAAVDVGILNLTGFESPDPEGHYFGQRKLGMAMRDVYGRLIDGMNGALGDVRSGGDAERQKGFQSPPPTEELVAYFSGPIQVGPDGYARTSFDLPSFNGTVRLMAVTWSKTGVGQAEADVLVRDPVVVTATLPRFLTPGDESRLLLEIVHATGPSGRMGVDVSADGVTLTGSAPSGVDLTDQGKAVVSVPLRAGDVGVHSVRVALTTPDGRQLVKDLTMPVQVNDPEISRQSRFTLAAGETFTFDANVFAGLYQGSATATLTSGPLARFDAPGLLAALDRYPYGCTEQVTSVAMPLLYFEEVAEAMGLAVQETARTRVDQAISRVLTNQAANGAFGLWRPYSGDLWLDAFVTDFLSRARAQGFEVPDTAYRMAMDNLRNQVNYYPEFDEGGQDLAYALYVLAREGAAAVGDLRYYSDVKAEAFSTSLAAAQLGAALAAYGDSTRADAMFRRAAVLVARQEANERVWRIDYGTSRRDSAAVLALAIEAGSEAVDRERLATRIAAGAHQRSTQEAVWALMATHALLENAEASLSIDGAPWEGPLVRLLDGQTADVQAVTIRNDGDREETLTMTTFGVPTEPEPADGEGWRIFRSYYTLEGQEADPSSVAAGTRLVTVLEVQPLGRREARLMVNDPLPAGFEIDNPNLMRAGDIRALDWLEVRPYVEHSEFRSDRFLAAVDHYGDEPFRLAYIVRAISPGTFHHPAASVEDMYRPQFRARTAQGSVTVSE